MILCTADAAAQRPKPFTFDLPPARGRVAQSGSLVIWYEGSTRKVFRDDPVPEQETSISVDLARNEVQDFQLVFRAPGASAAPIRLSASPLKRGELRLQDGLIRFRPEGYVHVTKPTGAFGHAGWFPDPLLEEDRFSVPADENQPVWVNVRIPDDAPPGDYTSGIAVEQGGEFLTAIPMKVHVRAFTIPRTLHLQTAFGFSTAGRFPVNRERFLDDIFDHRVNPATLTTVSPNAPPTDWSGYSAVKFWVFTEFEGLQFPEVPLTFVYAANDGQHSIPVTGLLPGMWVEVTLPLGDTSRTQMSMIEFSVPVADYANQDDVTFLIDNLRLIEKGTRREVGFDSCEDLSAWQAQSPQASIRLNERAKEGHHSLEFHVTVNRFSGAAGAPAMRRDFDRRNLAADAAKLDFTAFDKAVEKNLPQGLNTLRIPLPGAGQQAMREQFQTQTERSHLTAMARQWADHLREKSWLGMNYVDLFADPRPDEYPTVNALCRAVHDGDAAIRSMIITSNSALPPGLEGVDIWCVSPDDVDISKIAAAEKQGVTVWWQLGAGSNLGIDRPAVSQRILFWMTWRYGLQGLSGKSINCWTADPWQDPMADSGDCLVYPSADGHPVDSIRWELVREGMQDYEYHYLLQQAIEQARQWHASPDKIAAAADALELGRRMILAPDNYTHSPEDLYEARRRIADAIESLGG